MPNPTDLQETGPGSSPQKLTTDDMAAEMRSRGIEEPDIQRSVGAMRFEPGAQVSLTDKPQAPPQRGAAPADLREMGPKGSLFSLLFGAPKPSTVEEPAWLKGLGKASDFANKISPSPTAAASMAIPGAGLIPALARIGTSGVGQGAEAAMAGQDPAQAAMRGGAWQAGTEAVSPLARPVASAVKNYGGPALRLLSTFLPGAGARATGNQTAALLKAQQTAAPIPGEYMGKYIPTGIPASTLLGPSGRPIRAATPPQIVPHKDLRGWTLGDVLNQSLPKGPATKPDLLQAILRAAGMAQQQNLSPDSPETRL